MKAIEAEGEVWSYACPRLDYDESPDLCRHAAIMAFDRAAKTQGVTLGVITTTVGEDRVIWSAPLTAKAA